MSQAVFALHTGFVLVEPLKPLFRELLPGVRIVNVVDDGLLDEVREAGSLTTAVVRRILGYGQIALSSGAAAIFNCCSSVGEAADILARTMKIPVVKIDDRMSSVAVGLGSRIAVLATLPTTLHPTIRLVERKAGERGKPVQVRPYLAEGAFDTLMRGAPEEHDRLVVACIEFAARENDVVVLAQGSMARLLPSLEGRLAVPVLASPRLGVEALRDALS